MITGFSTQVETEGIEHMLITGRESAESPMFVCNLFREQLLPEEQDVYDAGVGVVANNQLTEISNTTAILDITRMTSGVIIEGTETIDFESLSLADKDKLRALLALILLKKN